MGLPPAVGSAWRLYCETSSTANYMQERKPVVEFNSATNLILQAGQFGANNSSPASTTQIAVSKLGVGFGAQNQIINAVSASGNVGKPKGKIRFETVGNTRSATYDVGDIDTTSEDHLYDALRYGIMTRPRSSLWDFNPSTQRSGFQAADPVFGY